MRRYMAVGLGLLLGLSAGCAGDGAATAPATHAESAPAHDSRAQQEVWRLLNDSMKGDTSALAELKVSRRKVEQCLLDMLSGSPAQRRSALCMMRDAPKNAPELADIVATPKLVDAVVRELEKMLQARAKNWGEAASRCVACQVLGKYGDRKCIPVLLHAMDEPFLHHDMVPAPVGEVGVEHTYKTIWWDADEALRKITGAAPVPKPARHMPEDEDRITARAAWLKWWAEQ